MRRTVAIDPAGGAQLLSEYAGSGLTVLNIGYSTVYLGEDALVSSSDGVPLPSGMTTSWSGGETLYAAADGPTQLVITDTVAPYAGAIPLPPPANVWKFAPSAQIQRGAEVVGVSDGIVIGAFAKITAFVNLTMVTQAGSATQVNADVMLEGLSGGSPIVLGTQRLVYGGATTNWQATIGTGQEIPWGGYRVSVANDTSTTNNGSFAITADSTITLIALPAGS